MYFEEQASHHCKNKAERKHGMLDDEMRNRHDDDVSKLSQLRSELVVDCAVQHSHYLSRKILMSCCVDCGFWLDSWTRSDRGDRSYCKQHWLCWVVWKMTGFGDWLVEMVVLSEVLGLKLVGWVSIGCSFHWSSCCWKVDVA